MLDIFVWLALVFLVGFLASFIGAFGGGGGLLSIPALVLLGFPPAVALATNKFGALGLSIGTIPQFWRARKIVWKLVPLLSILSLGGTFIGAALLVRFKHDVPEQLIGMVILALLPLFVFRKNLGVIRTAVSRTRRAFGYASYLILTIFAGFFGGAASGTLIFSALMIFFGLTLLESNATDKIPRLLSSILALVVFSVGGIINFIAGVALFLGMITGGFAGSFVAVRKGEQWLKNFFVVLVVALAIKLIFF